MRRRREVTGVLPADPVGRRPVREPRRATGRRDRRSPAGPTRPASASRTATRSTACSRSAATRPARTTAPGRSRAPTRRSRGGSRERRPVRRRRSTSRAPGQWCGTGWTGQPAVFERGGRTWVVFGAYDRKVHFLDAETGERILPDFPTGDIIKGSVTIDPDGFPLVYTGSRDNYYRVIAIDRDKPTELWKLSADAVTPTHVERRLGRRRPRHRRLPVRGRREQPVPHRQAEPRLRRRRQGDGRAEARVQRARLGRPAAARTSATATSRSRTRSRSTATPSTSPTPAASCRAGTSAALKDGRDARRACSASGPATTPTRRSSSTRQGMLYVGVRVRAPQRRGPSEVGQIMKLDPSKPDNPLVWKHRRPRAHPGRRLGHARAVQGHRHLRHHRRRRARHRPGDRRGALDVPAARRRRGSRRSSSTTCWSSATAPAMLHAYDVADTTTPPKQLWTVDARRLHRVDAGGLEGPHLLRHPGRRRPRHRLTVVASFSVAFLKDP